MTKVNEDLTAEEILVSIIEPREAEKMRQRRTDDEWQMEKAERHQHDRITRKRRDSQIQITRRKRR